MAQATDSPHPDGFVRYDNVRSGAYPFQRASARAVQALIDAGGAWPLERVPAPIVNPADPDISAPFLLRVVSHCVD